MSMINGDRPLVSIIIGNYNYGRYVGEAIDSALSQTYDRIEVIAVDDGSTDNSPEVIRSYGDRILPLFKANGGQSSAFNLGFKSAQGDIICFLDSDDIMQPHKVAELVKVFQSDAEIGWCFHPLKYINTETSELVAERYPPPPQDISTGVDFRRNLIEGAQIPVWGPATSGLSFRRSLLEKILPMPETIRISSDYYLRYTSVALTKGWVIAEPLAILRVHGDNSWTLKPEKLTQKAEVFILTGYWMKQNFPHLEKMANKVFSMGLGIGWHTGELDRDFYEKIVNGHLSTAALPQRIEMILRSSYHRLKTARL
jgi:glycosyltransferase involved in cell wall biosynthesis